jgi:hypothetical protein
VGAGVEVGVVAGLGVRVALGGAPLRPFVPAGALAVR